ncbi:MAG TPA: hypothetical protein VJX29_14750 [Candidatus Acidoferrales bacterium]|nr:hypothetical protein [Candidatus Acidoferrales bacterium]
MMEAIAEAASSYADAISRRLSFRAERGICFCLLRIPKAILMVLEDLEHRGEQLKQRIEMVRSYL